MTNGPDPSSRQPAAAAPAPPTRAASERLRCYRCASPAAPAAPECPKCGASFVALCVCGANLSVWDTSCGACSRVQRAKRLPLTRHPSFRLAKIGLLVLVTLGVGAVAWRRSERPESPWALKTRASDSFRDGRFEDAVRDLRRVTELLPDDREGWTDLAISMHNAGMPPEATLGPARKAHAMASRSARMKLLLATVEQAAGNRDTARGLALDATRLPDAPPEAWLLFAELELGRPAPDLAQVISVLSDARSRFPGEARIQLLLAEVHVNSVGVLDPSAYGPEGLAAIADAEDALARTDRSGMPKDAAAMQDARLLLAKGSWADAFAAASRGLDLLRKDAPAAERSRIASRLESTAGQALHLWRKDGDLAREHFVRAFRECPDFATAAEVEQFLARRGDWRMAEAVFGAQTAETDPAGAAAAFLAASRLARGALDQAAAAVAEARRRNPRDGSILILEGDIRAARGDVEGAASSWSAAEAVAPMGSGPALRRAMLALSKASEIEDPAQRRATLGAAVSALESRRSRDVPDLPLEIGVARLLLASGDPARALAGIETALRRVAPTAEVWLLVCEARTALGDAIGAANAASRARGLRPADASLHRAEAEALLRAGDLDGAHRAASRGIAQTDGELGGAAGAAGGEALRRIRADCSIRMRNWEDASRDLETLAAAHPGEAALALALGETLTALGRRDRARQVLDAALASSSPEDGLRAALVRARQRAEGASSADAIATLRTVGPSAVLAEMLFLAGDVDGAAEAARKALAASPGEPLATAVFVFAEIDRGGAAPESVAAAKRALGEISPTAPPELRRYLEARVLLVERRFPEARAVYESVEATRTADPVYWYLRGEACFHSGDRPAAVAAYRRAAGLPGLPTGAAGQIAVRLARCALDESDPGAAEVLARQSLQLDRGCVPAALRVAELRLARGESLAALSVLQESLSSPLEDRDGRRALHCVAAQAAVFARNPAVALVHCASARELGAGDKDVAAAEAVAHQQAGRGAESAAALAAALRADPDSLPLRRIQVRLRLSDPDAAARTDAFDLAMRSARENPGEVLHVVDLIRAFAERAELALAAQLAEAAAAVRPDEPAYSDLAVQFGLDSGNVAVATARAAAFASRRPAADPIARLLRAVAASRSPETRDEAIRLFNEIRDDPAVPRTAARSATALMAQSLLSAGRAGEARAAAESLLRAGDAGADTDPVTFRALRVAGAAAAVQSDLRAAGTWLSRAVTAQPRDPEALNNAAWVLAQSRDTAARAMELADRAVQIRVAEPSYWDTRGTAAAAADRPEDAEASYREALRLHEARPAGSPDGRARTALRLAVLYFDGGKPELGRQTAAAVAGYRPAPSAELLRRASELSLKP